MKKGVPDAFFLPVDTAFGQAGIIYSSSPFRINRVFLPKPEKEARELFPFDRTNPGKNPARALRAAQSFADYFKGHAIKINWDELDLEPLTLAEQKVLRAVARISRGETRSYGQIAAEAGVPGAARFVGNVMAKNPFPVFIPCHRVVRSDGSPGGFGGGTDLKIRMLALESARADMVKS